MAVLTAPPVGIVVGVVLLVITTREGESWSATVMRLVHSPAVPFFLMLGSPGAYLMELALGIPTLQWMRRRNTFTIGPVLLAGAVAGILAVILPLSLFSGGDWDWKGLRYFSMLGGGGGLGAALWFWLLAFAGRSQADRS